MAQNVYANGSAAKEIFINQNGSWTTVKGVWVKSGGSWVQCFPAASGTYAVGDGTPNSSTSALAGGSYSWTVPNGIYSITVKAAGGGGGAYAYHDGGYCQHAWAGGPGGGVQNVIIPVTPGDTISGTYGSGGGSSAYNGVYGASGTATTCYKNGSLVFTCGAGGNNPGNGTAPTAGTSTITGGYSGTTTTGTVQSAWLDACDGGYPYSPLTHYNPWDWVLGGDPAYPQSVLGTVAVAAPSTLTNYASCGMPQCRGFVSITW